MAINPPDLAFGIKQIATGADLNDGTGDNIRDSFEKINFDLVIIAGQLHTLTSGAGSNLTLINSILDDIADIQSAITALVAQQNINTADIAALDDDLQDLITDVGSVTARLTTAELNISNLQVSVGTLQGDLSDLDDLVATKAPINSPVFTGAPTLASLSIPPSNDNSNRIPSTSWVVAYTASLSGDGFASGTGLVFYQDSPPAGWVKASNVDDHALRVDGDNSGTKVSNGSSFTTAFRSNVPVSQKAAIVNNASSLVTNTTSVVVNNETGLSTNPHVLTVDEIPAHSHQLGRSNGDDEYAISYLDMGEQDTFTDNIQTGLTGGGLGHSHTIPNHAHTTVPHSHTLPAHSHSSPVHDHTVNLNVNYLNVMVCIKS